MEGTLWNFITFKNPLPSVRFEAANLGFNGKHANHYTTDTDLFRRVLRPIGRMLNIFIPE
jgi:hypothetical protein